jgi:hypothetical protein
VEEWIKVIEADDKIWDQNAFNDLFRRGAKVRTRDALECQLLCGA